MKQDKNVLDMLRDRKINIRKPILRASRTKEGKKFILTNKLKERNNFIAAFQLLGAYDRYYYSIKDLEKRSFLADNNWLR